MTPRPEPSRKLLCDNQRVDPTTPTADFSRLMQYGAVGVVACGLLTLVVLLFRRFVEHAIDTNKKLYEQNATIQREFLNALHTMKTEHVAAIHAVKTELIKELRDLHQAVAHVVNEMPSGRIRIGPKR